ncbi:hypothetical protein ES708_12188 [subsurface metagenome]
MTEVIAVFSFLALLLIVAQAGWEQAEKIGTALICKILVEKLDWLLLLTLYNSILGVFPGFLMG